MKIRIHNTLSGKKELFEPLEPNHVKLYVCGITSYDYCHIGHARSSLAFDMIVKYLRYRDYQVTYVRNFTDIDDKIIARAQEKGMSADALAERFIDEFYHDMDHLGVARPDIEPKATEHIPEMIDMITTLIDEGRAYEAGGDVYYIVDSFPEYGKLSKRNIEDMKAGARISVNEQKINPMDFVLWKAAKPGEPSWSSPWGEGRPGWHIECSAMSKRYLGETFDIHGGGQDLIFPHHENEIAQSEGANCCQFVKYWIHHGFVTIRDEKMSKSLGNFLTIRDILDHYHPEVLRFFIFSTHYRSPLDFGEAAMQDAEAGLARLYQCLLSVEQLEAKDNGEDRPSAISDKDRQKLASVEERFIKAMDNDFNTAQAQGIFFDAAKIINRLCGQPGKTMGADDRSLLEETAGMLTRLANIMGLLMEDPASYLSNRKERMVAALEIDVATIEKLIQERLACRARKDWAESDAIRDRLLASGIELKDGPEGTSWTVRAGQAQ
jgi:cysteinyl-tRNA synthetase